MNHDLGLYEQIIHNQAVTHERLTWLVWLLVVGILLGLIILVLQTLILSVKIATRRDIADMKELLVLVKDWVYSAKSHVKDAQMTLQDVKQTTSAIAHPSKEEKEIAKAVEELPERTAGLTADRVIERLSGDDIKRLLLPLGVMAGLAGAALAAPRAGAADELRRVNAAAAVALADSP